MYVRCRLAWLAGNRLGVQSVPFTWQGQDGPSPGLIYDGIPEDVVEYDDDWISTWKMIISIYIFVYSSASMNALVRPMSVVLQSQIMVEVLWLVPPLRLLNVVVLCPLSVSPASAVSPEYRASEYRFSPELSCSRRSYVLVLSSPISCSCCWIVVELLFLGVPVVCGVAVQSPCELATGGSWTMKHWIWNFNNLNCCCRRWKWRNLI